MTAGLIPDAGLTWPGSEGLKWHDKALCTQVGGDIFYPRKGDACEEAKALCRSCEARVPCLAYALQSRDGEGIFGGFTERARLKVARRYAAGESLEDIIAEDDAKFYARIEALEAGVRERDSRIRKANQVAVAALAAQSPQSEEVAA